MCRKKNLDIVARNAAIHDIKEYLREEKKACVREMVEMLPAREKHVIYRRYNLDGANEAQTLREMSKVMGVSSETVRQIELRAVRKLRAFVDSSEIRTLYNA